MQAMMIGQDAGRLQTFSSFKLAWGDWTKASDAGRSDAGLRLAGVARSVEQHGVAIHNVFRRRPGPAVPDG